MKKSRFILLITLVIVFAVQAMACSCFNFGLYGPPHMNDRVYERLDEQAFVELTNEIYALLEEDGNLNKIKQLRDKFFENYYWAASTMYTLASINYDKDNTSQYWAEESVWITNFASIVNNTTLEIEKAIFSSEYYSEDFIKIYGQDYANSILIDELESEEQLAILAEIATLEAQYNNLYAENNGAALYETFIKLINARNRYARTKTNSEGNPYKNFMDYAYENVRGREYSPEDVVEFRNAIKTNFLPVKNLLESLASQYTATATLSEKNVLSYLPYVIQNTCPTMISSWNYMIEKGLYDFTYSTKKANTSYVTNFNAYGDAFIFVNPSNSVIYDLKTLIHEFGHYNEVFMSDPRLADPNGVSSYDLLETHSQAFEFITLPSVKNLFNNNYSNVENLYETYLYNKFDSDVWTLLINCAFDEFEYVVYNADPEELTPSFLRNQFSRVWEYYWSGSNPDFYQVPHFFAAPAYCISYAVSLVFSAEIWASDDSINNYLTAVKYGGANHLSTVYTALGLESPLSTSTVETVANEYKEYINTYILN